MQHATAETVRGDFNDAKFTYQGVTSNFFKRDGKFFVRTDGPDGKLADFEVKYTFGVEPLQQYLVELPGGRLQALAVSWDTRPKEAGGQRWFRQYPDEKIDFRDELHWTRRAQNWNFMCADCHSSQITKGYDATKDAFATHWNEISVGCESCHGPGSAHVAWADSKSADPGKGLTVQLDERRGVSWSIDPATGNATRSRERTSEREIEVCAQCHARRAQIAEGYRAGQRFMDHYLPALLMPGLYHVDGQQRDEVFIWGSWLQSRMHRKGRDLQRLPRAALAETAGRRQCSVRPVPRTRGNSTRRRTTIIPQALRARSASAATCPRQTTWSSTLGAITACACRARTSRPRSACPMPAMPVIATAQRSGLRPRCAVGSAVTRKGSNASPRRSTPPRPGRPVPPLRWPRWRTTSASHRSCAPRRSSASQPPEHRMPASPSGRHVMSSRYCGWRQCVWPSRCRRPSRRACWGRYFRIRCSRCASKPLARWPASEDSLTAEQRAAWQRAADEYLATLGYTADRPEARVALGSFQSRLRQHDAAQAAFAQAIALDPAFVPAYLNAADDLRAQKRDAEARQLLQQGLAHAPKDAALHYALGLTLVRLGERPAAVSALERAVQLAPGEPRYTYVYAVALNSTGRAREAIAVLERAAQRWPANRDVVTALATLQRDAGQRDAARRTAARLATEFPNDPEVNALVQQLR